jgi:hypothetical protein
MSLFSTLCLGLILQVTPVPLYDSQAPLPKGTLELEKLPPFSKILGQSYEWTLKNLGKPVPSTELPDFLKAANPAKGQLISARGLFNVADPKGFMHYRSLQVSFFRAGSEPPRVHSVSWSMGPTEKFDEAMKTSGLILTDFEFVEEKAIAFGMDVNILTLKSDKKVMLEIRRTNSTYSVRLYTDLKKLTVPKA